LAYDLSDEAIHIGEESYPEACKGDTDMDPSPSIGSQLVSEFRHPLNYDIPVLPRGHETICITSSKTSRHRISKNSSTFAYLAADNYTD